MAAHQRLGRIAQHLPTAAATACATHEEVSGELANPLTAAQVARFDADGFLNGGQLLTDAEVSELSAALDQIIEVDLFLATKSSLTSIRWH